MTSTAADRQVGVSRQPQRVLDIDLDFFVYPVIHNSGGDQRPLSSDHSVWPLARAADFIRDGCGVTQKLPGFITEKHDELFPRWHRAIDQGILTPPFHVTHIDAHADLGLGDCGYKYLMTELLFQDPDTRPGAVSPTGRAAIAEGNFLLYAVACRWISDLTYVFGEGGGSDELPYAMKSFDRHADRLQLSAITPAEFARWGFRRDQLPNAEFLEPEVTYRATRWEQFATDVPYDFLCLTRSPAFAPISADPLFDMIRTTFVASEVGL